MKKKKKQIIDKVTNRLNAKDKGSQPSSSKKTHKRNSKLRIPRVQGTTYLMDEYKDTNNKEYLTKAKNIVINHWMNNSFTLNGTFLSLPELANYLNIKAQRIIDKIAQPLMLMLSGKEKDQAWRGLLSQAIFMGHHDRALAMAQWDVFARAQYNKKTGQMGYKPFISDAASKHIGVLNNTTKTLAEIAKLFKPESAKTQIVPLKPNTDPLAAQTEEGKYLGITEAIKLLEGKVSPIDNLEAIGKLLEAHSEDKLPEVGATKQQGLSQDGLTAKKKKSRKAFDTSKVQDAVIIPDVVIG